MTGAFSIKKKEGEKNAGDAKDGVIHWGVSNGRQKDAGGEG